MDYVHRQLFIQIAVKRGNHIVCGFCKYEISEKFWNKNRISQTFRGARRLMSYTEEILYISCNFPILEIITRW
jgi:hypothetical protein